jgi:hypothetical protein
MRYFFSTVVSLVWALWLGGLLALFVFVKRLFAYDHALAVQAAPQLFLVFQKCQLILAAIGLVGTIAWRLARGGRAVVVLFVLFGLSTVGAAVLPIAIVSKMEQLRSDNQTSSPEFKKLHGESMAVLSGEAILLLVGGAFLPAGMKGNRESIARG